MNVLDPAKDPVNDENDDVAIKALREWIAEVDRCRLGVMPLYRLLARDPLSAGERKARGARIDRDTPEFVRRTADALERPGYFPEYGPSAVERLRLEQELAGRLAGLRFHLTNLDRLAGDHYLDVQTQAQRDALAVHEQVRTETALRGAAEGAFARQRALAQAWDLAPNRRRKAKKRRPRKRK